MLHVTQWPYWRRRNWLKSAAIKINKNHRKNGLNIFVVGMQLAEVKEVLRGRGFYSWLKNNIEFSVTLAKQYMRWHRVMKEAEKGTLRRFLPSAVRLMIKKNVNNKRLANVLGKTKSLNRIGYNAALDAILGIDVKRSTEEVDVYEPTDEEKLAANLDTLNKTASMVHLSISNDDNEQSCHIIVHYADGTRESVLRPTIKECVAAVVGAEKSKKCFRCGEIKPICAYSPSSTYCRMCDSKRISAYYQKRKNER